MVRDTSIVTYKEIISEGIVGIMQAEVLEYLAGHPDRTDTEIAIGLGYSDMNKVRPRRKELLDFGIIEDNGTRECIVTGRVVHQWRIKALLDRDEVVRNKDMLKTMVDCPLCKGTGKVKDGSQAQN